MNAWALFKRMPIVVLFACIATVMMLLISEGAYWQSVKRLDALVVMGGIQAGFQNAEAVQEAIRRGERIAQLVPAAVTQANQGTPQKPT